MLKQIELNFSGLFFLSTTIAIKVAWTIPLSPSVFFFIGWKFNVTEVFELIFFVIFWSNSYFGNCCFVSAE